MRMRGLLRCLLPAGAAAVCCSALMPGASASAAPAQMITGGHATAASTFRAAGAHATAGGTWGKARKVPGLAALSKGAGDTVSSVSCATPGNCGAVGSYVDG